MRPHPVIWADGGERPGAGYDHARRFAAEHGRLAVWCADGHVVCEVRDSGKLDDPLAGRRPADRREPNGRGLLLVNDLADLVRVHTGPEGTVIRAFVRV